jgi:vacuolar-type H+-ATPase subunit E/Vma4
MKARDELLEQLKKETLEKLGGFCKSNEYSNFVKKLIVQGLIKIEEQVVEVQARAEDKQLVSKVVSSSVRVGLRESLIFRLFLPLSPS